jgi:hypothetical protein
VFLNYFLLLFSTLCTTACVLSFNIWRKIAFAINFAIANPNFDSNYTNFGMCFSQCIIDIGTECVKGILPSLYISERAISAPPRRPEINTLIPSAPILMVEAMTFLWLCGKKSYLPPGGQYYWQRW